MSGIDPQWLASVPFFDGFGADAVARFAELGDRVDADAGAELTDQGRFGDVVYVIEVGQASVYRGGEYVATVGPGTMVGEMAVIDHRPRSATVRADSDMELVSFGSEAFRSLLEEMPELNERVQTLLHQRLEAQ